MAYEKPRMRRGMAAYSGRRSGIWRGGISSINGISSATRHITRWRRAKSGGGGGI